jgi:hypothetical protein
MKTRKKKSQSAAARPTRQLLEQGPVQIAVYDHSSPIPVREVSCSNYQECLNIAACLNWLSFSCENCTGEVAPHLRWQARIERRRDPVCQALMPAPVIEVTEGGRFNATERQRPAGRPTPHQHDVPIDRQSFIDRRNALDAIIQPHRISNPQLPSPAGHNSVENASNED